MQGLPGENAAAALPDRSEAHSQQAQLRGSRGRRGISNGGGWSGLSLEKCMGEEWLTSPKLGIVFPTRLYCSGLEPAPAHDVSDPICGGPESYRQPSVIINHSGGRRIVRSPDVERRGP